MILICGIGVVGFTGWNWLMSVTLEKVQMQGLVNATESEVRDLIMVDSGEVLFRLDAAILEDRIRRHPWIMSARVSRLPTGTLDIRVIERHPVVRVMEESSRPDYFMDRNGYRMPQTGTAWYPAPILSGILEPYNPVMPVRDGVVLDMLRALPLISDESDALLSELRRVNTGFEIRTTPQGNHASLRVLMGKTDFEARFALLERFWEQQVLRHQDVRFASIDLRFNSQVVTEEFKR